MVVVFFLVSWNFCDMMTAFSLCNICTLNFTYLQLVPCNWFCNFATAVFCLSCRRLLKFVSSSYCLNPIISCVYIYIYMSMDYTDSPHMSLTWLYAENVWKYHSCKTCLYVIKILAGLWDFGRDWMTCLSVWLIVLPLKASRGRWSVAATRGHMCCSCCRKTHCHCLSASDKSVFNFSKWNK